MDFARLFEIVSTTPIDMSPSGWALWWIVGMSFAIPASTFFFYKVK